MSTHQKTKNIPLTYKDYCEWPEGERYELIDGEAFDMTPPPSRVHQEVVGELFRQLANFFHEKECKVYSSPFAVRLPKQDEPDQEVADVVEPDILVICDPKKLDEKGARGAPDLVVEVLSPATASKDHIRKKSIYERHGVKEYWLIDPINRLITLYRQSVKGNFEPSEILASDTKLETSLFPGLVVDFSTIFPRENRIVKERPWKYLVE